MTPNTIIGAFPKIACCSSSTRIDPGMRLYVFSDGVYEVQAPDGAMWDLDGLQDLLARPPRGDDLDAVYARVREVHGANSLDDDFSLLRVEFP